jgi:lactoylglutathione lyase
MMKLLYTGIRVRDLDRSVEFYRNVMGMSVSRKGRMSHGGLWVEMQSSGSPQRLELNWYPPGSRFHVPYRRGEELDHLGFRVTDAERAFREVTARGARAEIRPFKESRYAFAFVSDPDGIWIELLGRVPGKKVAPKSSEGQHATHSL